MGCEALLCSFCFGMICFHNENIANFLHPVNRAERFLYPRRTEGPAFQYRNRGIFLFYILNKNDIFINALFARLNLPAEVKKAIFSLSL